LFVIRPENAERRRSRSKSQRVFWVGLNGTMRRSFYAQCPRLFVPKETSASVFGTVIMETAQGVPCKILIGRARNPGRTMIGDEGSVLGIDVGCSATRRSSAVCQVKRQ
jgi:hypothetical protein